MASIASAATISVQETLHLLDGPFASFAEGVAENRYALWLGSGISLGRVEGLRRVVPRVIEFLRVRITGDPACRFKKALSAVLQLAQLSEEESSRIDFSQPFNDWRDSKAITGRLISKYATLLDTEVKGEPADYLLWEAVGVVSTFADPRAESDVEHLCIAILILEGVASDIASANWDGLIEGAVDSLAPEHPALVVCVRSEDLRQPDLKARLFKFHGCAVKAGADEATYRPYLTGRQSQISSWRTRPENAPMAYRLIELVTVKPTLMMGLSGQDSNIQALFAEAESRMKWPWPGERPSYVFSEDEIGTDQKSILRNVYREAYTPDTSDAISESAVIRAYAKPLLIALVLHVICSKLKKLIELAPGGLGPSDQQRLHQGVLTLRDMVAATIGADKMAFIRSFIEQSGRAITMFREGRAPTTPRSYNPIIPMPVQQIAGDTSLSASGLREAAVAAGILGLGVSAGDWTLNGEDAADPEAGMIRINGVASSAKVFFVINSYSAVWLQHNGHVADAGGTILIHSHEKTPAMQRSPRGAPGRTGRSGLREVSISALLNDATNVDELMQRFREEVAV
jgi:SIR2-like domain